MHGSIVSVPTNLKILYKLYYHVNVLWRFFNFCLFAKYIYKSTYNSSYVCPNIVIKTLQEIYKTLLYTTVNFSIQSTWKNLTKFTNASEYNHWEKNIFEKYDDDSWILQKFKKNIEKNCGNALIIFFLKILNK